MAETNDSGQEHPIIEELRRVRMLVLHKKNRKGTSRIQKDELVDHYIRLVSTLGRANFNDLLEVMALPSAASQRARDIRAVRKAVRDIAGWIDKHNAEAPENPIRVNFDPHLSLMVSLEFVQEKSVTALVASARARLKGLRREIDIALGDLDLLAKKIG